MGLVIKDSGDYQLAPAGQHRGVCVDVVDLGNVAVEWQGKKKVQHKCRVVWEIDALTDDGRQFVVGRRFTASLSSKAALRAFLEMWRGKAFTEAELAGFDTEQLIGVNAVIQVIHEKKGDKTYDNVNTIMKPMKGMDLLPVSGKYVRVKDRVDTGPGEANEDRLPPDIEEECPF